MRRVRRMKPVQDGKVRLEGVVTQSLPNAQFRVKIKEEQEILGHVSGKMRKYYIKIIPGDRVILEVSSYDLTKGRIVQRL